jgi:hypothetical protein
MKLLIALIIADVVLGAAVWSELVAQRRLGQRLSIGEDVDASRERVGPSSEGDRPEITSSTQASRDSGLLVAEGVACRWAHRLCGWR